MRQSGIEMHDKTRHNTKKKLHFEILSNDSILFEIRDFLVLRISKIFEVKVEFRKKKHLGTCNKNK